VVQELGVQVHPKDASTVLCLAAKMLSHFYQYQLLYFFITECIGLNRSSICHRKHIEYI